MPRVSIGAFAFSPPSCTFEWFPSRNMNHLNQNCVISMVFSREPQFCKRVCVCLSVCPSDLWSAHPSVMLLLGGQRRAGKRLVLCLQTSGRKWCVNVIKYHFYFLLSRMSAVLKTEILIVILKAAVCCQVGA